MSATLIDPFNAKTFDNAKKSSICLGSKISGVLKLLSFNLAYTFNNSLLAYPELWALAECQSSHSKKDSFYINVAIRDLGL